MKRIIRIALVCILSLCCFTAALGCGAEAQVSDEAVYSDFENYVPDIQLCRISSNFGKVSVNTDKAYVKSGNRSARIDPVGNGWMYFPMYSENFGFDYTDFTYVNSVRLDMYNPQQEDKTVRVGLISRINNIDSFDKAYDEEFTLKNGWNTLEFYVEPSILGITADITEIQGISLSFEMCNEYDITDKTPRYYLDGIKLIKRAKPHSVQTNIEFAENEIMDFEKFYHEYFTVNDFGIEMSIVKTADYGIATKTGNKALRMVIPQGNSGSWNYYLKITAPFLNAGALGKLTDEQFENGYFVWDSYNGASADYNCVGLFFVGSSTTSYGVGTHPKPGEWTTNRIKLTDIEQNIPGWRDNTGMFALSIKDSFSTDRELFLDNFRIEYAK